MAAVRDVTLEDRLQIGDQILEVNGHTTGTYTCIFKCII